MQLLLQSSVLPETAPNNEKQSLGALPTRLFITRNY
jgi:hypothetical protein